MALAMQALQKTVDCGFVDNWLRNMAFIVDEPPPSLSAAFNEHILDCRDLTAITHMDILRLRGLAHLLKNCQDHDICIDMSEEDHTLILSFDPQRPFAQNNILGRRFTPSVFGLQYEEVLQSIH